MGNNQAYSTFQRTVINLYNRGKLDLEMLDELAEEYRGTDIDSGGDLGIETKDGKTLEQVCIELVNPGFLPRDDSSDEYYEWERITTERWGWE